MPDDALFIEEFRTCFINCENQLWHSKLEESPKLSTYRLFKTSLHTEHYLLLNIPRRLKVLMAKFRISNHDLQCERGSMIEQKGMSIMSD